MFEEMEAIAHRVSAQHVAGHERRFILSGMLITPLFAGLFLLLIDGLLRIHLIGGL